MILAGPGLVSSFTIQTGNADEEHPKSKIRSAVIEPIPFGSPEKQLEKLMSSS